MSRQGVISLGDAFIDYISKDSTNTIFHQFPGGATVNTAVWTSRIGVLSYYLTKLGTDEESAFVEMELVKEKVNVDYCVRSPEKRICSVKVHINQSGERQFHSYNNPTPDLLLTSNDLPEELFQQGKLFYFGSGTLFHDIARETTRQALEYARKRELLTAFDTNIRLQRWESEKKCRKTVISFAKQADIVKMAEDELFFLTETNNLEEGLGLISEWGIPFLFITMGGQGSCAVHKGRSIFIPGVQVKAVDTTGAGDAFMAAIISRFHNHGVPQDDLQLEEFVRFANEIGARATTKMGAL
ncbi:MULTISPECIES: carbohydrate kinase family protein [Neobacillus]|uniref:Carbohydrate kinase n=1 Tax=Neobacillus citreus TaxID=2833578 RepID=A0A942SUC4_9BACI|nr:carbohydrate kinase [Neobacillus citreus]MCH6266789.1 carbohydrate kinase [Neobacillus citreus]